ncbi:DUF3019 domain-containing protein [Catenovulum sediminis]|uniref:DUF3019 domain-containing protein n=1 Tax=Catenovulum sediminis TaxID=1740262 RepID=A0ABV1RFH3_9ALTE|nr:DUF3019 domain-containing protein [Catenovulum sediminis]
MRFNQLAASKQSWVCVVLFLICPITQAQTSGSHFFSVKPVICLVQQLGQKCQMKAEFSWQLLNAEGAKVCVWQEEKALHCWQNKQSGRALLPIELKQNTVFYLKAGSQVLFEQLVRVAGMQPRKYRNRLHSDWSLF